MRPGHALFLLGGALASILHGCGYRLANEVRDPLGPFELAAGPVVVPHAEVIVAAEAGARAELARAGELGHCARPAGACAELVVEVLRVDEQSEGIAVVGAGAANPRPIARGLRVTVTGRAHLRTGEGSARDTGDVSTTEVVASPGSGDLAIATLSKAEASRRAARRLGERLVRRILGAPEPSAE